MSRKVPRVRAGLGVLLALISLPVPAVDVVRLEVGDRGRAWFVEFEALLEAPPAAVMAVLTDYARYPQLDPRVVVARLDGEEDGRRVLYTVLNGCLGSVFCHSMERYERLTESATVLIAESIPGRGDMRTGYSETEVRAAQGGARVRYRTEFEPAFWMPHWLVRRAMLKTLEQGTRNMFQNVESLARGEPAQ